VRGVLLLTGMTGQATERVEENRGITALKRWFWILGSYTASRCLGL